MNRPSRNDDIFHHPCWNQSPPNLPADLTTRQDLNGSANSTQRRGRKNGSRTGRIDDGDLGGGGGAARGTISDTDGRACGNLAAGPEDGQDGLVGLEGTAHAVLDPSNPPLLAGNLVSDQTLPAFRPGAQLRPDRPGTGDQDVVMIKKTWVSHFLARMTHFGLLERNQIGLDQSDSADFFLSDSKSQHPHQRLFRGRNSKLWSWVSWVLSVVVAAVLLNLGGDVTSHLFPFVGLRPRPRSSGVTHQVASDSGSSKSAHPDHFLALDRSSSSRMADSFREGLVPIASHIAPLQRRSDCASGNSAKHAGGYNLPLHVASLFIILAVSTSACMLPVLAIRFGKLKLPGNFLFGVRHFGTGVLIATAFVHLLPTAFTMLSDPCLSDFWTQDYPAMPGAIALAAIFVVVTVEMILSPAGHVCGGGMEVVDQINNLVESGLAKPGEKHESSGRTGPDEKKDLPSIQGEKLGVDSPLDDTAAHGQRFNLQPSLTGATNNPTSPDSTQNQGEDESVFGQPGNLRKFGPLGGRSGSISRAVRTLSTTGIVPATNPHGITSPRTLRSPTSSRFSQFDQPTNPNPTSGRPTSSSSSTPSAHSHIHNHAAADIESYESQAQRAKRAILQCLLLELGILFHSVFIGMAIAVSVGKEFIVLLIAISFHQTFEGLALGARIATLPWPQDPDSTGSSGWINQKYKPWLMAIAYGCTTPLGQAIGMATHTLYSPNSQIGLLLVGIMNSISAGLLVFASLVELLSEDFLSDDSWKILRGKRRVAACLLVAAGAFGMSLVGAWA